MRISKTTDYALRIMLALADGERLSLQTLARRENIPRKFLEHVIRNLKDDKLIISVPGPKGGYELALSPSLISIGRIVAASQGSFLAAESAEPSKMPDHMIEPAHRLSQVMAEIRSFARQRLESITLADLAEVSESGDPQDFIMYYI